MSANIPLPTAPESVKVTSVEIPGTGAVDWAFALTDVQAHCTMARFSKEVLKQSTSAPVPNACSTSNFALGNKL